MTNQAIVKEDNIDDMCNEFFNFVEENKYPHMSADELLAEGVLKKKHVAYVEEFSERWWVVQDREAEERQAKIRAEMEG